MIQIFLDGVEVFTEKNTSIQISKENPAITEAGDYSLDVVMPLSNDANAKFFGNINRIEVTKEYKTYSLKIRNSGISLLDGIAVITKVTDTDVSLQFLAGNSVSNFWLKANEVYIDELGWYYNMEGDKDIVMDYINSNFSNVRYVEDFITDEEDKEFFIGYKGFKKIENDNEYYNMMEKHLLGQFCFAQYTDTANTPESYNFEYIVGSEKRQGLRDVRNSLGDGYTDTYHNIWREYNFNTAMPCISRIFRKVVNYMGYKVKSKLNILFTFGLMYEYMYIASALPSMKLADALPHWTVKKFLDEIQKFMNVTLIFDETEKTCTVISNTIKGKEMINLDDIEDIFECNVTEENTVHNEVMYKEDSPWTANVGEDIRKAYNAYYLAEGESVWDAIAKLPQDEKSNTFIVETDGNVRVRMITGQVLTVDRLGPVVFKSSDRKELNIIPAPLCTNYLYHYYDGFYRDHMMEIPSLQLASQYNPYNINNTSIFARIVDGESDNAKKKEDVMRVFLMGQYEYGTVDSVRREYTPEGEPYWIQESGRDRYTVDVPYVDSLFQIWNVPYSLASQTGLNFSLALKHYKDFKKDEEHGARFENSIRYDGNKELRVRFLSATPHDVSAVFLIRGKRYACKKIEYDITDDGIDPLMTGYFVEILE